MTWRDDAVRRLLADPSATDLFFTDAGVLQVTDLDIDLAPELKELFFTDVLTNADAVVTPTETKWPGDEVERRASELLSLAYANGLRILTGE